MPLRMSTVPELLKLKPLAKVVVPVLTDLRKVPALSNRLAPKLEFRFLSFCTWNNAPGRLVMTAPKFRARLPAPDQASVPPFSSVRLDKSKEIANGEFTVADAPGA